jgi:hypothetical protein
VSFESEVTALVVLELPCAAPDILGGLCRLDWRVDVLQNASMMCFGDVFGCVWCELSAMATMM